MALTSSQLKTLRGARVDDAGNRIDAATKLAGVTQAELSRALGMSQQYVNDVARGRYQTITVAQALRFSEYFGCNIEDLFPAREERASA
jgi:transcriptional regulator with XRE-family HTH domain